MTKTLERPSEVEGRAGTELLDERQTAVKEPRRPVAPPPSEPTRFVRWLAWIVVSLAVLGTAGVIWLAVANPFEAEPVAPAIEAIDPHESPEIVRTYVPLMAPAIESIDPHESPEILRGIWGAGSIGVDLVSMESLGLLRSMPTQGIDPLSLESLELVSSLPSMAPAIDPLSLESLQLLRRIPTQGIDPLSLESLQLLRSLPAAPAVEIDPHESPEALRTQVYTVDIDSIDPHESPEILRKR